MLQLANGSLFTAEGHPEEEEEEEDGGESALTALHGTA